MKTAAALGVVGLVLVGLIWTMGEALDLPIVQKNPDGVCVRVLIIEGGREVARPCKAFDLKYGKYRTEYVAR